MLRLLGLLGIVGIVGTNGKSNRSCAFVLNSEYHIDESVIECNNSFQECCFIYVDTGVMCCSTKFLEFDKSFHIISRSKLFLNSEPPWKSMFRGNFSETKWIHISNCRSKFSLFLQHTTDRRRMQDFAEGKFNSDFPLTTWSFWLIHW